MKSNDSEASMMYKGFFHGEHRIIHNKRTGQSRVRKSAGYFIKHDLHNSIKIAYSSVIATNRNEAQYQALIILLEKAIELHLFPILIYGDSQLVIKQMQGVYKVKSEKIRPLYTQAKQLSDGRQIVYSWVPSLLNSYAYKLSKKIQTVQI